MKQIKEGYKQTKVGIIPEDWEDIKIKDIVKVSQGLQIAIDDRFTTPAHNRVFYITIPFIEGKKEEYIENPKSSTLCKKDDILVVRTGSGVGKIIRGVEGAFHNNFFKVKPSDNINIDFFYYFLTSPRVQFLMAKYAGNSAIPDLNHGDFYSLDFLIPPLKEQEKIAEILTTWDEAITKQTELLRAKELQKKALMQKLLSGEVRFNGFNDVWQEIRLDKLVFFQEGPGVRNTQYRKSGVKLLNVGNLNNNILNLSSTETYISEEEAYGVYKHFLVDEGDLLISCSGINSESFKKKIAFVKKEHLPLCMNTSTMRFKNLKNKLLLEYLYFFFQTLFFEKQVFGVLTGSAQFNFGPTHIKWFKIKLPSLPEQQKIAEVLSLADDEINLLKNELEELKLQKKALMQKLLTGEVRVKV